MKEFLRYEPRRRHHHLIVLVLTFSLRQVLFHHFPKSLAGQTLLSQCFPCIRTVGPMRNQPHRSANQRFPLPGLVSSFPFQHLSVRPQLKVHHPYRAARVLHIPLYPGQCQQNSWLFHPGLSQQTESWKKSELG